MKKTTLNDIANKLGLSPNSISVALRGAPGLSSETRSLILRTAQEMGYTPKKSSNQKAKNILMVSRSSTTGDPYFFNHLFIIIQKEVTALGYALQSINTEYMTASFTSKELLEQFLKGNNIAGILILGDIEEIACKMLSDVSLPIVGTSFYLPGISMSCVVEDNFSGAYLLVHHLVQRGYRKMGFVGNLNNVSFLERYSSFKGALTQLHLPSSEHFDLLDIEGNDFECLQLLENKLSKMSDLPEVFVCCNDQMAAVTLKALLNCGLNCPQDIGIVGFDNNEIARLSTPTITSIDTSRNLQGSLSINLLDKLINGQSEQNLRIVLPVQLEEGTSVLPNLKHTLAD